MLSRKCSSGEPSHNIGAFFNTIDPTPTWRRSVDSCISADLVLKAHKAKQEPSGHLIVGVERQALPKSDAARSNTDTMEADANAATDSDPVNEQRSGAASLGNLAVD